MTDSDIISGRNPVLEAIRSGRAINKILIEKNASRTSTSELITLAKQNRIPFEFVDRRLIAKVDPKSAGKGVIAYVATKEYANLDDLLRISKDLNEPPFFVILDGIEDPQNLGAILRTADAAGVHGVITRTRRAAGLTAGVSRASAGAVEYVPVARVANITQVIDELKKRNVWVIGIDMNGETDYRQADYKTATAIVIGSEGKGLSHLVRQHCDSIVRIPMKGKLSSLNASVAAALIIYEVYRQRS